MIRTLLDNTITGNSVLFMNVFVISIPNEEERMCFYYINTNEITGELSCENKISSHVNYHRCYGYIINCAFQSKEPVKWFGISLMFT